MSRPIGFHKFLEMESSEPKEIVLTVALQNCLVHCAKDLTSQIMQFLHGNHEATGCATIPVMTMDSWTKE